MRLSTEEILAEASQALEQVVNWKPGPLPPEDCYQTRCFVGSTETWSFVIMDFSIESQGFPSGSRGADGAATCMSKSLVLHLSRELAQRGLELALKVCGGN